MTVQEVRDSAALHAGSGRVWLTVFEMMVGNDIQYICPTYYSNPAAARWDAGVGEREQARPKLGHYRWRECTPEEASQAKHVRDTPAGYPFDGPLVEAMRTQRATEAGVDCPSFTIPDLVPVGIPDGEE